MLGAEHRVHDELDDDLRSQCASLGLDPTRLVSSTANGGGPPITSRLGYVTAGQVDISGDGVGGWGYLRSAGKWIYDGQWGWVFARHQSGQTFAEITCGPSGLQMNSGNGSFRMWGPGFNLDNGGLTIGQVDVIDTLNLRGQAVTVPTAGASGGTSVTVIHEVPGDQTLQTFIFGCTFVMTTAYAHLYVDGVQMWTGAGFALSTISGAIVVPLSPGRHTLTMASMSPYAGVAGTSIYALSTRR